MKANIKKILPLLLIFFSLLANPAYADISDLPSELKDFWAARLSELKSIDADFKVLDTRDHNNIAVSDVWFKGYGNIKLHGYLAKPSQIKSGQKLPAVLLLHGYSDYGRPGWADRYARMGFIAFAIDFRGHGLSTKDYSAGFPGFMTSSITNASGYSITGAVLDAVRSIDFLETLPDADKNRIYISGSSMGGGIAMIVSVIDDRVRAVAAGVPFLNNIQQGIKNADGGPYLELRNFIKARESNIENLSKEIQNIINSIKPNAREEQKKAWELALNEFKEEVEKQKKDIQDAMDTLKFADVYNYAPYIKKPILIGIGGRDTICPKEGIKSVIERMPEETKKKIYEIPDAGHVVLPGWHDENKKWFLEN
ncbi:MAG: alpha/beta fold hydrolase [Deltaproteobacteria bacterium]|nr:alpha/beta fold hydrolase [Deltaproteobacteria bacterium]